MSINFGEYIRIARERAGLTQAEVASAIGHTVDSIVLIECGSTWGRPSLDQDN